MTDLLIETPLERWRLKNPERRSSEQKLKHAEASAANWRKSGTMGTPIAGDPEPALVRFEETEAAAKQEPLPIRSNSTLTLRLRH